MVKAVASLVLVFGIVVNLSGQSLSKDDFAKLLPKIADDRSIAEFIESVGESMSNNFDVFAGIAENKRLDLVIPIVRKLKQDYPDRNFRVANEYNWTNPLNIAILARDRSLIDGLIDQAPELVSMYDAGGQWNGVEPISTAVRQNDLVLVSRLFQFIQDPNQVVSHHPRELPEVDLWKKNLLTLSTSKQMDDLLISNGVAETFSLGDGLNSYITDTNVNVRSAPSLEGKVLSKLNKNDRILLLEYTAKRYRVGQYSGSWVKIEFGALHGWVLESFVHQWEK